MNRRTLIQMGAAASTLPLAGCSLVDESSGTTNRDSSPTTTTSLVGVTFAIAGTAKGTEGTQFSLDPSQYTDEVIEIDIEDNAGPLVGHETDDGTWEFSRQQGWESVPRGAQVVATVRKTETGKLKAVKIFVHAAWSVGRPPDS